MNTGSNTRDQRQGRMMELFLLLIWLATMPEVLAAPRLQSAAEPDYPPLSFRNKDGHADGMAVDMLRAAVRVMGREVYLDVRPWNLIKQELAEDKLDVLPLVARNPEREEMFDFTVPYLTFYGALVVRKDDNVIYGLDDLSKSKIGVMRGDVAEDYMRREGFVHSLVVSDSVAEALHMLDQDELDVVVVQQLVAQQLIGELGLENVEIRSRLDDFRQDFCFAVTEGDKELLATLNEGLSRIVSDGTYSRLREKWLGSLDPDKFEFKQRKIDLSDTERQWVRQHPEVKFTGPPDWLPYGAFDEHGNFIGIIADYLREVEKKTGLVFRSVQVNSWAESRQLAGEGYVSVLPGFSSDENLGERFLAVEPFGTNPVVIIMDARQHYVEELGEIKNGRIGLVRDHAYVTDVYARYPSMNFIEVENIQKAFEALSHGRLDAVLATMAQASYTITGMGLHNVKIVGKTAVDTELSLFVRKDMPILHSLINKSLKAMHETETQNIMRRWGKIEYVEKMDYGLMIRMASALLLALALILVWNYSLRREVSIRRRTEASLQASEQRLAQAQGVAHMGSWELDLLENRLIWSDEVYRIFEVEPATVEPSYEGFIGLVHPDDRDFVNNAYTSSVESRRPYDIEHRLLMPDGRTKYVNERCVTEYNESGKAVRSIGTVLDITDRKNAERARRESEERFRTLVDSSPDWVWELNTSAVFNFSSSRVYEILGYLPEELEGKTPFDLLAPDVAEEAREIFERLLAGRETVKNLELVHLHKNGRAVLLEINGVPFFDDAGEVAGYRGVNRDITEKKQVQLEQTRLQRELQQAQKMESLGQLTGGIAHDFNNLLGIINGYSRLTLDQCIQRGDEQLLGYMRHVSDAGNRAAKLVEQMLAFSRSDQFDDAPIEFASLIQEDLEMLRATLPTTIEISCEIEPELPPVVMDPTQLHQIMMNLSINARDAMQGVGKLTVWLGWARDLDTESPVSHRPVKGDWIELCVSDTGSGIEASLLDRIFNPFFTTKEVGKGTGMGLAVIYSIMEAHGGHILLETEKDGGTTFRLLFPPGKETDQVVATQVLKRQAVPRGDGSEILVVDDELGLSLLMTELLNDQGYRATGLTDSGEALALLQQEPDRFSALVTDQTMPGLSGIELIQRLRETDTDLPVLLCTGYSDKIDMKEATELGIPFFTKPVDPEKLFIKLAEVLKSGN